MSATGGTLLEVRDLAVRFGGLHAVDGVSFGVEEGSITALIGPNGAGKTTCFHLISGFQKADSGDVHFAGRRLSSQPSFRRARAGMVRTFQIPKVFARLRVLDNLLLAANDQPSDRLSVAMIPFAGRSRTREIEQRAVALLDVFGLAAKRDDYAGELSGGQRKLLEFARALMTQPRMLLLDEPLAGVNPALGDQLFEHITRLRREEGITFLFIEHDMTAVMNHSDRILVMGQGKLIAAGTPAEVRDDPAVIDAYLGQADD